MEQNLNWDLKIVSDLHGRTHDQNFLPIFVLNLANDVQLTVLIKEDTLARETIEVDFEAWRGLQLLPVVDHYL